MKLKITNLKNGISKTVDASSYTMDDLEKVYRVYEASGRFQVKIARNMV